MFMPCDILVWCEHEFTNETNRYWHIGSSGVLKSSQPCKSHVGHSHHHDDEKNHPQKKKCWSHKPSETLIWRQDCQKSTERIGAVHEPPRQTPPCYFAASEANRFPSARRKRSSSGLSPSTLSISFLRSATEPTGTLLTSSTTSPTSRFASAAGLSGAIPATSTPSPAFTPAC